MSSSTKNIVGTGGKAGLALMCALLGARPAWADDSVPDDFSFFQKEAKVVTASRQPSTIIRSPSTVYVVTSEDIIASGAQTLWDALRTVPGVDVMSERTSQGDVGIRGLNEAMNNNVLVLLDGKTVLNGFFDSVDWEAIPVTMEEIARIEVVEGPASALYGSNAVSGVINIITKTPEQLKGGIISATGGDRDNAMGTALIGNKIGAQAYKLDLGWRSTNMFSDGSAQASSVGKARGFYSLDLPDHALWSVEGGIADQSININNGPSFDDGETGFLRTDFKHDGTSARFFWNSGDTQFRDHPTFPFEIHSNTYDLDLEQKVDLPFGNSLTGGGEYRRNTASSDDFAPGTRDQTIGSFFFEDVWNPADHWSVVASAREDHDSLTGWQFSPRGSVVYAPVDNQSFRFTGASAFSNPNLFDDYVSLAVNARATVGPLTEVLNSRILPNSQLGPEKIEYFEGGYRGDFDWIKASATGFYYRLTNAITSPPPTTAVAFTTPPPTLTITDSDSLTNDGETKAIGGELAFEVPVDSHTSTFANYSYQSLIDQLQRQTTAHSAPKHKVNFGARYKQRGWTADFSADWVDKTYWSDGSSTTDPVYDKVPAYFMLNARLAYRFSGSWDGLEAAVSAFNVADKHYETLAAQSAAAAGQNAELIGSRWSGTLSYRFGL
jgi:iron complex outermembrane receptor protein